MFFESKLIHKVLLKHDFRLKILSCHSAFERSDQDALIDTKKEGSYKVLCAKVMREIEFSKFSKIYEIVFEGGFKESFRSPDRNVRKS